MEVDVFGYFVAIGSGLMIGLTLGGLPIVGVMIWLKGRGKNDYNTQKTRR